MNQGLDRFRFETSCDGVDWAGLKARLVEDRFDNGRTPDEYEKSSRNSHASIFVYDGHELIGNARVLSDGVCNAYMVDVWVYTPYRRIGVGTAMILKLLEGLRGQHVCLFTDDHADFYVSLGFCPQSIGMSLVAGSWLNREGNS
jgi:predicted GNAT family acetyltransferase